MLVCIGKGIENLFNLYFLFFLIVLRFGCGIGYVFFQNFDVNFRERELMMNCDYIFILFYEIEFDMENKEI